MAAQGWAGEEEATGGEFALQWDVDRVNLDFKTVADLEALLAERGLALDYQLFKESDQVDAQLRDELHQWPAATLAFPGPGAPSSSVPGLPPESSPASPLSSALPSLSSSLPSLSSLPANMSSADSLSSLTPSLPHLPGESGPFFNPSSNQVHIFTGFLTGLLLLLLIAAIVVLIRCKAAFKQRFQDSGLPQRSTYVKSSLSLDDNSRFVVNLRNPEDSRPLDTRVEVGGGGPHVSLSHCSSISQLANSPIYSPAPVSPAHSPPPVGSFSTFLPPTRTSPEGSESAPLHRTHSASNICHQATEEEVKKCSLSSADRDEGIESEEDIDATAFKQLILSNVGPEEGGGPRQLLQLPPDKEDLYAKPLVDNVVVCVPAIGTLVQINFESKRQSRRPAAGRRVDSVESPSTSLCSDGSSPTLTPPSSSLPPPTTTGRVPPSVLWSKSATTTATESECLI